ncbi:unnamed protein product [Fraxinus pennsylvanica]|uniref:Shugoshin C-terminal domain-containing protein n=1 Tax=Fraxinus pennsylvanica TaxID=56036 RepID=A0AAD2E898_9LAMI|nr:unnamed protein product [Fraxinus pennsylvanica]
MQGDKVAKRSSLGNMMRRGLSDVTNSLPLPKSIIISEKSQPDSASASASASAKDYIDNLIKENMAMVKLIQEKNKIVELTGIEIQNLRACLQKMQMQNWNLAQSNSHMSAELNLGKERLKALQHEIGCKEALLRTKNLELKEVVNIQNNQLQEPEDNKTCNANQRRNSRSQSLGPLTICQQATQKEAGDSKRRCLRRQSAISRIQQQEPNENLFEIEDVKFPVAIPANSSACADGSSQVSSSNKKEDFDYGHDSDFETQESRRTSITRPMRRAVEKVQSYKERPVNIKMRRT